MNPTPPADGLPVYDPRGVVTAVPRPIAPRAERLDGLRLAVLDNTKWNATVFCGRRRSDSPPSTG